MTEENVSKDDIVHMGDRTAIIAAGIAIGVTLIAAPGFYSIMDIPIGLVLIATLHAADSRQDGNWFQSASFSLAWALSFLLIAGLFLVNPYISDPGQGIILLPHIQWITNTFNKEAADVVSVCIVGVVAIIWFIIRRRFFALHQAPSQPRKPKFVPSNSSGQLLQSLDLAEKCQEHGMELMSDNTYHTSKTEQLPARQRSRTPARNKVILSSFMAIMALCVYIISSRWLKHI